LLKQGVDVNHAEKGSTGSSVVAVVGSMDGMLGQYCAHISVSTSGEPVADLESAISSMLTAFSQRNNGKIPRRIIVYRDGVADNQFDEVLEKELFAYKDALAHRGYDEDYVKLSMIICQKRHHSRFVYESGKRGQTIGGDPEYLNPCAGLCIDARSVFSQNPEAYNDPDSVGSVSNPDLNEFYLNSQAAVLGTSKMCKYTLLYDENGLELVELELLTYWISHLYFRCTRSVSCATPGTIHRSHLLIDRFRLILFPLLEKLFTLIGLLEEARLFSTLVPLLMSCVRSVRTG
jgi:eukaryotic translation initiation factor 2C